ncbi:wing disc-specific protein [Danaus plexippus plexippus]|uniref:Wing disc-specific protein n=1 Tax=Danaus plexippus plexippus TaxID=278856 RepID=A0A212FIY0_DANPL|nr:wing disc-specific protein [Danaus plexippus plexippus]
MRSLTEMAVSCVIVFALLNYVTATPHDYAKTGAIAKAEAHAVAGGFGSLPVIPLSIPSGTGYSGGFSKSSSSSYAASSASASSSSSSYSFSSNNGIAGIGCNTGNCKGSESTIPSSINGSPNGQITFTHESSEAQAAAEAKAASQSSTYFSSGSIAPCQSGNCFGPTKCVTGQCNKSAENFLSNAAGSGSVIQSANTDTTPKCATGNCFPTTNQAADNINNSDDIEVNVDENLKSGSNSYSPKNPQFDNSIKSSSSNSPKCNGANCDTFLALSPTETAPSFAPEKPATHLVTPNFRPICTSHNCQTDATPNNINGKPSSYNVPILGTNPNFQQNIPVNPSTKPFPNIPSSAGHESNCGPNGCGSNIQTITDFGLKTPKYSHVSNPPPQNFGILSGVAPKPSYNTSPCTTPNCGSFLLPNENNSGWTNKIQPSDLTSVNHNAPTYTNVVGSNTGSNTQYPGHTGTGNFYNVANNKVPSYVGGLNTPKGSLNGVVFPSISSTVKPNLVTESSLPKYTGGFGGPKGPVDAAIRPGSLITHKPHLNEAPTESNLPRYTGGFGGPSGSVTAALKPGLFTTSKPNVDIKPAPETVYTGGFSGLNMNKPLINTNPTHGSGYTIPNYLNTGVSTFTTPSTTFVTNLDHQVAVNSHNLQNPINEKEKLPKYTGGFGGPQGILNPNEFTMPSKLPSVFPTSPCATTGCNSKPVLNENHNNADVSANAQANAKDVVYSGGFGGPSGVLEPSEKDQNINTGKNKQDSVESDIKTNSYIHQKTPSHDSTNIQANAGLETVDASGGTKYNTQNADTNLHIQNNQFPIKGMNENSNSEKDGELNEYIKQANSAGSSPGVGLQYTGSPMSPDLNANIDKKEDAETMLNDYIKQANFAGAFAKAGAQSNANSASSAVDANAYGNSDNGNMLNDYIKQANIANAFASAGAESNVGDQENFVALSGSHANLNSGCNACKSNLNSGAVAGATAAAKSHSSASSWANGKSLTSGTAAAYAAAGASVKGGYGRR